MAHWCAEDEIFSGITPCNCFNTAIQATILVAGLYGNQ